MQEQTEGKLWAKPLPLVIVLVLLAIIIFGLSQRPVSRNQLRLSLETSNISLTTVTPDFQYQPILNNLKLSRLNIQGLQEVQLPEQTYTAPQGLWLTGSFYAPDGASKSSVVHLSFLEYLGKCKIWIERGNTKDLYHLIVEGESLRLGVHLDGQITVSGFGEKRQDLGAPDVSTSVKLTPGKARLQLSFIFNTPPADKTAFLANEFFAQNLMFHTSTNEYAKVLSGIETGTLFLESLNDKEYKLYPGDFLFLPGSEGVVRRLRFKNQLLNLEFHGHAQRIHFGFPAAHNQKHRDVTPSQLLQMLSNTDWNLFWLVLSSFATAIFGLFPNFLSQLKKLLCKSSTSCISSAETSSSNTTD